jgi:hypothetical protein
MARGMEMLRRMLVLGGIAATHVAADSAQPQVDPGIAHFQALLAALSFRFDVSYLVQVLALIAHGA